MPLHGLAEKGEHMVILNSVIGHSGPAATLQVYAHLFNDAANIDRVRDFVDKKFAELARRCKPQRRE